MKPETKMLLEAFELLSTEEKQVFVQEVLRHSLPVDSGPISDNEIAAASSKLVEFLDTADGSVRGIRPVNE